MEPLRADRRGLPIPRVCGDAYKHARSSWPRAHAEKAAVLDKRKLSVLGRGSHRSCGSRLLYIRELVSFDSVRTLCAVTMETGIRTTDPSLDTNPRPQRETLGNELGTVSAYYCGFCNYEQRPETYRLRLRIRRSQVRVLPSAPLFTLQSSGCLHPHRTQTMNERMPLALWTIRPLLRRSLEVNTLQNTLSKSQALLILTPTYCANS